MLSTPSLNTPLDGDPADLETLVNFANRPKVTNHYDAHAPLRGGLPDARLEGNELPRLALEALKGLIWRELAVSFELAGRDDLLRN